jgi:2'-hydroxyisoflavone reductase
MKVLILGGTVFLGRHYVERALALGHQVTLFNRGQSAHGLYPEAEHLTGDRDGGLNALRGRTWDAVIDTSGYVPRVVSQSVALLSGFVGHYTFVSTISVYRDFKTARLAEDYPLANLSNPASEDVSTDYGALKAACEKVVLEGFPGRALILRAGLIAGPYDNIGRFPWWIERVACGGEVLAPGDGSALTQVIDARDIADFSYRLAADRRGATLNLTGPGHPLTIGHLLATIRDVTASDARFTWLDESFLLDQGAAPWQEIPFWAPGEEFRGLLSADISAALSAGLTFRPLEDTIRDTWQWLQAGGEGYRPGQRGGMLAEPGLAPEKEQAILAAWKAAQR